MNKKMLGSILGAMAISAASSAAYAADEPTNDKHETPMTKKKGKGAMEKGKATDDKATGDEKAKGGDKACGGDKGGAKGGDKACGGDKSCGGDKGGAKGGDKACGGSKSCGGSK